MHKDMQPRVRKAMKFKEGLGEELPGNDDDIFIIYSNTLATLDTIGYSSTGITIDANSPYHFSPPIDNKRYGDSIVVTHSAMGSMSDLPKYKNSIPIPDVIHIALSDNAETIQEIKNFLNPKSNLSKTKVTDCRHIKESI